MTKEARLVWLARVFSGDKAAVAPDVVAEHIVEPAHVYGIETTTERFPPLKRIHAERGSVEFSLGEVRHTDPDRSFVEFCLDGALALIVVARFEEAAPHRMKYWGAYPPLPDGVDVRPYESGDAPSCRDLELRCPMDFGDGTSWVIDRGDAFDDYLRLAEDFIACVAVDPDNRVVGFLSNELRPIDLDGTATYCVYQHHYRVDPDYRGASVSMALSTHVDSRRAYEHLDVPFPYSLVDGRNVRMQNMGFPKVDGVDIARLSIPLGGSAGNHGKTNIDEARVCELINLTHGDRRLFQSYDVERLRRRCSRIADYALTDFWVSDDAVLGVWCVNERTIGHRDGQVEERRLAFALDYGFETEQSLIALIERVAPSLAQRGATHVGFVVDCRAPEYTELRDLADDEQRFNVHTLPWLGGVFSDRVVHCDAVYC